METSSETSVPTGQRRPGRPAAGITLQSAEVREMDAAAMAAVVEALANVIRLDWDLAGALMGVEPS